MHNSGADPAFSISDGPNVCQGLESYGRTTRKNSLKHDTEIP